MRSILINNNFRGRRLILALAISMVLGAPGACLAMDLSPVAPAALAAFSLGAPLGTTTPTPAVPPPMSSKRVLNWETGEGKSYIIPGIEIPAFIAALNGVDRLIYPNDREN